MRSITGVDPKGKKVLVRCDFNVPLDHGRILDPARIDASLQTIRFILNHGGAAILCSHLGRPKKPSAELSLKPVAEYLSNALARRVVLAPDCIGDITGQMVRELAPGEALLLENLRFHPEEEKNDAGFAKQLAQGKDVYINDAFGTAHRAHASTAGVVAFLPEHAAGFLLLREVDALRRLTESPAHPYVAILGGAKVSDKIDLIRNFLTRVDTILIGGAMAYTFLVARGNEVGKSLLEKEKVEVASGILAEAGHRKVALVLPSDHVVAPSLDKSRDARRVVDIPPGMMALDIGPVSASDFAGRLAGAKTVVWNGPLGYVEDAAFRQGTLRIAEAVAHLQGAFTVIAGGDTVAAIHGHSWSNSFSHISTGGGATLEFLEGRVLPGIKALES